MKTETEQIINALPPAWQSTAQLAVNSMILLVAAGYFAASHGGIRGIALALWRGKDSK